MRSNLGQFGFFLRRVLFSNCLKVPPQANSSARFWAVLFYYVLLFYPKPPICRAFPPTRSPMPLQQQQQKQGWTFFAKLVVFIPGPFPSRPPHKWQMCIKWLLSINIENILSFFPPPTACSHSLRTKRLPAYRNGNHFYALELRFQVAPSALQYSKCSWV